ncbi:hypothetical protein RKD46_000005 [Streptomyces pseudovenezuelae]
MPADPPAPRAARGTVRVAPLGEDAQIGVDQHHVVAAPVGGRTLQTPQRGGTTARRGHVDVRFGRERGGQGLGKDAVVVDHQNPDTRHRHPPMLCELLGRPVHGRPRRVRTATDTTPGALR